jgi:hypothetical protein
LFSEEFGLVLPTVKKGIAVRGMIILMGVNYYYVLAAIL